MTLFTLMMTMLALVSDDDGWMTIDDDGDHVDDDDIKLTVMIAIPLQR